MSTQPIQAETTAFAQGPGGQGGRGRGRRGRGRGRGRSRGGGNGTSGTTGEATDSSHPPREARVPKPRLTHFLALPIGHHTGLQQRVSTFTDALQNADPAIPGLDRSIIINPRRLHLTLGVMSLDDGAGSTASASQAPLFSAQNTEHATNNADTGQHQPPARTLTDVIAFLGEIRPQVMSLLGHEKLRVALSSMDIMKLDRRDMEKAHVMWIGPSPATDDAQRLKSVAEFVRKSFKDAGFLVDEGRPLMLHCTVMNTIYRKPRQKLRQPFSFASVLSSSALQAVMVNTEGAAAYAAEATAVPVQAPTEGPVSVDLGIWDVDEIQVCEMGSHGPEGEYVCVGRCSLV